MAAAPVSDVTQDAIAFLNAGPSPFHSTAEARRRLLEAGFVELHERDDWALQNGGKYFTTRNQSCLIGFAVGGAYKPNGESPFAVIGTHTDSPCLKVRSESNRKVGAFVGVGSELYGGGIWHTWFDRDLGLAGRVIVRTDAGGQSRLVRIHRPVLRIPTLAIHLDRSVSEKLEFNKESNFLPILATVVKSQLGAGADEARHSPVLLELLARELECKPEEIADFELSLYDMQPACTGGAFDEFIFSARLDNLMMTYCAITSLVGAASDAASLAKSTTVAVASLFDNEEVGSMSDHGADSSLLRDTLTRVIRGLGGSADPAGAYSRAARRSLLVSADMAHAAHPNYPEKHGARGRPEMHKGPVVKNNFSTRYATTAESAFLLKEIARRHEIPLQEFFVRNDIPCGTTIGPMSSSILGMRTVDIGNPQLSMHSIREQCGTADIGHAVALMTAFYREYDDVDGRLEERFD